MITDIDCKEMAYLCLRDSKFKVCDQNVNWLSKSIQIRSEELLASDSSISKIEAIFEITRQTLDAFHDQGFSNYYKQFLIAK